LEPGRLEKLDILEQTANMLKKEVEEKGFLDVGAHVERDLPIGDNPETNIGISKDKFNTAISMLKEEGYQVHPSHSASWYWRVYQLQGFGQAWRYSERCLSQSI
jgi:hypothetical protein